MKPCRVLLIEFRKAKVGDYFITSLVPLPALSHCHRKELFPYVQAGFPVSCLLPLVLLLSASENHLVPSPLSPSCKEKSAVWCHLILLFPRLNKPSASPCQPQPPSCPSARIFPDCWCVNISISYAGGHSVGVSASWVMSRGNNGNSACCHPLNVCMLAMILFPPAPAGRKAVLLLLDGCYGLSGLGCGVYTRGCFWSKCSATVTAPG